MKRVVAVAVAALMLAGCDDKRQNNTSTVIESPFLSRPIVAIVPMLKQSRTDLNWDVSQELTLAIRQRLTQTNHLYLMNEESVVTMARRALRNHHPFENDISWVKKAFPQNEFVAFTELLEHHEVPLYPAKDDQDSPAELNLTVRIRLFDIREATPKVVLQEIVQQSHHIPRQFNKSNFNQVPWGDETFEISPLGMAHEALTKEIASRIEDYTLLSGRR